MNTISRRVYQQDIQSPQYRTKPKPLAVTAEQNQAITVFIFDSLSSSASQLRRQLEAFPEVQIVGESADASRAVAMLRYLRPHLVIVNSEEETGGGVEATRRIRTAVGNLPIMVLSSSRSGSHALSCFRAGASGYCLKNAPLTRLVLAIRSVSEGAGWIDPELSAPVLRPAASRFLALDMRPAGLPTRELPLSDRELQVLRLVAEGMSNHEIAADLVVSPETVKSHIKHIMEKLAVNDRTQAVVQALRLGLVS